MWIAQSVIPISLLLIVVMSLARIFVQVVGAESAPQDGRGS
jgi:hypothetical protein